MGFAPFTIFFMACLIGFFGNSDAADGCSVSDEWPDRCANKTYCQDRPKGYPTTNEFKTMRDNSPGFVYMIKDTENRTRYVVQDPEVFRLASEFKECKLQVQLHPRLKCRQRFTTLELPVTTCDGTGIELFNVSIPTNCGANIISDYD